ncbi:MAG TPA: hypothetical protein VN155_17705, partial [Devosia sp.]|nr:hypothetical protein [Devosia sp.]
IHGVIPAEAGIHVRGDPQTSSAGMAFSMDSGLRRNDIVGDLGSDPNGFRRLSNSLHSSSSPGSSG